MTWWANTVYSASKCSVTIIHVLTSISCWMFTVNLQKSARAMNEFRCGTTCGLIRLRVLYQACCLEGENSKDSKVTWKCWNFPNFLTIFFLSSEKEELSFNWWILYFILGSLPLARHFGMDRWGVGNPSWWWVKPSPNEEQSSVSTQVWSKSERFKPKMQKKKFFFFFTPLIVYTYNMLTLDPGFEMCLVA